MHQLADEGREGIGDEYKGSKVNLTSRKEVPLDSSTAPTSRGCPLSLRAYVFLSLSTPLGFLTLLPSFFAQLHLNGTVSMPLSDFVIFLIFQMKDIFLSNTSKSILIHFSFFSHLFNKIE